MAGTLHADDYTTIGIGDNGRSNVGGRHPRRRHPPGHPRVYLGAQSGPEHWVLDAAIVALNRWVRTGPRHRRTGRASSSPPARCRRSGATRSATPVGGIRTPELDVPIAALTGTAPAGQAVTCQFFGSTTPFDEATLTSLYPTHADYVAKFDAATRRAVTAGFILSRRRHRRSKRRRPPRAFRSGGTPRADVTTRSGFEWEGEIRARIGRGDSTQRGLLRSRARWPPPCTAHL